MCFDGGGTGSSTMTIKTSEKPKDGETPDDLLKRKAAEYGIPATDPDKPNNIDLSDETLKAARKTAKLRAAMGYGRTSTFLTGPQGVTMAPPLGAPSLLGG